jgi:SAM-dependent methyltransferase
MTDVTPVKDPSAIYDQAFYAQYEREAVGYLIIAHAIHSTVKFGSVLDVGCGPGRVMHHLMEFGHDVYGFDGSRHALQAAPAAVRPYIEQKNLVLDEIKFDTHDLVMCTEVAEHLDAQYADILVDIVCRHARKSVFWTAAVQGQGGLDHVNEQPPEYWFEKFGDHGFVVDAEATLSLRNRLGSLHKLGILQWCALGGTVFKRRG